MWGTLLQRSWQDLTYAGRVMRENIGFTLIAVLTLSLGIGVNTAIFSVVNAVLLRTLPYEQPDELVKVWNRRPGFGLHNDHDQLSTPEFFEVTRGVRSFSAVAATEDENFNVVFGTAPERLAGQRASVGLFALLGVRPLLGRTFLPEEEHVGRDQVTVISYGLWVRHFAADPAISGKQITVDGRIVTIVGVLPRNFSYADDADIWVPITFTAADRAQHWEGSHSLEVVARLRHASVLGQARNELTSLATRLQHEYQPYSTYSPRGFTMEIVPLADEVVGNAGYMLQLLLGAVGVVLLIACANVANLLLARASHREKEMAIRCALGGTRWRLVRQLLTESLLLSILGATVALLLASWIGPQLGRFGGALLPRGTHVSLDAPVFLFTMALSICTGVLFGLAPALASSNTAMYASLKDAAWGGTTGRSGLHFRSMLVVAEIALSLVLVVGAGLLIKSMRLLQRADAGFKPQHVLTLRLSLLPARYQAASQKRRFFYELLLRIRALSGVVGAGGVSALPLAGVDSYGPVIIDSAGVAQDVKPVADQRAITPGYFAAMGINLVAGRDFVAQDTEGQMPVAIIDESMAKTYFSDRGAIGKRLKSTASGPWATIVGVVRHVRYRTLERNSRVQVYWPAEQRNPSSLSLVVQTAGDQTGLVLAIQKQVAALDPEQPLYSVKNMEQIWADSLERRHIVTIILGAMASLSVVLAAIGIYGVMSYMMTLRLPEMGIRMALGAKRIDVLLLAMSQSARLTFLGIVLGIAASFAATRVLSSMLYLVSGTDLGTLGLAAGGVTVVAAIACFAPVRRATKIDPIMALRHE